MKTRWIYPVIAATALAACAKDGGGSSSESEQRPSAEISGTAFDGLIANGDVVVSTLDGAVVGRSTTDDDGNYSISLNQIASQPLRVEISSGSYKEEFSAETIVLENGNKISALINYVQGEDIHTSVTYFTTISAGYAEYNISNGMAPDVSIYEANNAVSSSIGLNIVSVTPVDITDAENVTPHITDGQIYGYFTSAISAYTGWVSEIHEKRPHELYNSIAFAQLAYDDIKYDGKLDGVGSDGAIAMGKIQFSTDTYRYDLALNMLVMANHENNKLGYAPSELSRYAKTLAESANPIFAGAEIKLLNVDGTLISNPSWTNQDAFYGDVALTVDVFDLVGVTGVTMTINGVTFTTDNLEKPAFTFDSVQFADGTYDVVVEATNATNVKTHEDYKITFANRGTTIVSTTPVDGQAVGGEFKFGATVVDPFGVDSVVFVFDDTITMEAQDLGAPSVVVDTKNTLGSEGQHEMEVHAVGLSGYEVTKNISFIVDNTAPTVTTNLTEGSYISSTFALRNEVNDNIGIRSASVMIDGREIQAISAKGAYPVDLNPQGYSEGSHTLVIEAFDQANNKTTLSRSFYIDRNPPIVNITTASGAVITGKTTIRFEASDSLGFGSKNFIARIVGYPVDIAVVGNASRSFELDPFILWMAEGNQTLEVTVSDGSGKTATDSIMVNFQHWATSLRIASSGSIQVPYETTCTPQNSDTDDYPCTKYHSYTAQTFAFDWASGSQTINSFKFNGSEIKRAYYNSTSNPWVPGQVVSDPAAGFTLYGRLTSISVPCAATTGTLEWTVTDAYGVRNTGAIGNFRWCTE